MSQNLTTWDLRFTYHPKEGLLRILIFLKNPSPARESWVQWQAH
jgi:hypothetical protein